MLSTIPGVRLTLHELCSELSTLDAICKSFETGSNRLSRDPRVYKQAQANFVRLNARALKRKDYRTLIGRSV